MTVTQCTFEESAYQCVYIQTFIEVEYNEYNEMKKTQPRALLRNGNRTNLPTVYSF